jgi:hypothetical protein
MNATERMIQDARVSINKILDNLQAALKGNADFLADMNAANATHDPGADFGVAYIASPVPELPNLDNVTPFTGTSGTTAENGEKEDLKDDLVKKFGLEQTGETPLIPDEKWANLCRLVIVGHEGKEVSKATVSASLIKQGFAISPAQEEHLEELRKTRRQMLTKDMDLAGAQALNWATDGEKLAFAELATNEGLK